MALEKLNDPAFCPNCDRPEVAGARDDQTKPCSEVNTIGMSDAWWRRVVMCEAKYRWMILIIATATLLATCL